MKLTIRKPNLSRLNNGIPKDFLQVMELFNTNLRKGNLRFIPRKTEITEKEIEELWIPYAEKNISYLAFSGKKLVASGTLLIVPQSNQYSLESGRETEYSLIFEPGFKEAGLEVTKKVLEEAKSKKIKFVLHVSVENKEEIEIMNNLGLNPTKTIDNYERYAKAGLNPKVYEYIIT
jgi:hypothetical protein